MTILIFNLSGGFTDMKKNLIAITLFTKEHNYKFTIKNCTARPQSLDLNRSKIEESIIKNGYMYDVKHLFDEKNAFIDFLIGMNAVEVLGFSHSGFSVS